MSRPFFRILPSANSLFHRWLNGNLFARSALPDKFPSVKKAGLLPFIIGLVLTATLASFLVLALYPHPEANMQWQGAGPFYMQYNPDSPNFFHSALGFPSSLKILSGRASRPLTFLVTKPLSAAAREIVLRFAPGSKMAQLRWGDYLALEHLVTYYSWILLNCLLLFLLLYFTAELMLHFLHPRDVGITLLLIAFTAPVLLALTWLHTVLAGWVIMSAALAMGLRLIRKQSAVFPAALIGVLFLGKFDFVIPFTALVLLYGSMNTKRFIILALCLLLPTLLWKSFCIFYGIDGDFIEVGMVRDRLALSFGQAMKSGFGFVTQNLVALFVCTNPLVLWFAGMGLRKAPWRNSFMVSACGLFALQLLLFFAVGRAGSIYVYELMFLPIMLFFLGFAKERKTSIVPASSTPSVSFGWGAALLIVHLSWQAVAIYAQLNLWRNDWWF